MLLNMNEYLQRINNYMQVPRITPKPPVSILKVREGRRAANFPKLCLFFDYTAISVHIIIDMLYINWKLNIIAI